MPIHTQTPAVPGLGRAPEGQGRLDAILHVELAVPYFPFRQTTPFITTIAELELVSFSKDRPFVLQQQIVTVVKLLALSQEAV